MRAALKVFNTHHCFRVDGESTDGVIGVVTPRGDLSHEQSNTASLSRGPAYSSMYGGSTYDRAMALHTALRTALRTKALRTKALRGCN
jgi:hypothetical protein